MYLSQNVSYKMGHCVDIDATCFWPLQLGKDKSETPLPAHC